MLNIPSMPICAANLPELLRPDRAGDVDEHGFTAARVDDHQREAREATRVGAARGRLHEDTHSLAVLVHADHRFPTIALELRDVSSTNFKSSASPPPR